MSEVRSADLPTVEGIIGPLRRGLAALGAATRRRTLYLLMLTALGFGVMREMLRPHSWRRTVWLEFRRSLRQATAGALVSVLVTAGLIGVGIVNQALFWLGEAGQENLIGSVLVSGLIRGIAPVLVGFILLGRSGMLALAEIGAMNLRGQIRVMNAQGIDPFLLLIFPRALALAVACFTLTAIFIAVALLTGFIADVVLQHSGINFGGFLDDVLKGLSILDLVLFPIKTLGIGMLIALTAGLSAFQARPDDSAASLLPRGFVRGVLAIILINAVLTFAV